jgi:Protein of unknown function (DUF2971)
VRRLHSLDTMVLFGDLEPGEAYWYHYTRWPRLAQILDGGALRIGPYAGTNDPREAKDWWAAMFADLPPGDDPSSEEFHRCNKELREELQQKCKLLCLTEDQPVHPEEIGSWAFRRGWGRARMWAQYADSHTGACLILDPAALQAAIKEIEGAGSLFNGPVQYRDQPITMFVSYLDFRQFGAQSVIEKLLQSETRDSLFFIKNTDWATETEYRFVLVTGDDDARFVPIVDSLKGIVIGETFPEFEATVLRDRLGRIGLPDLPVGRCFWHNGAPQVLPFQDQ